MREISFRNDILPLKDKLYRLALRITLNSAEAEDVVQDTMIRVWNKRDEWPQFESIEAYCLTIARNLAIDRSQKMEAQNLQLTSEVREMPDTLTPYDRLAQNEQMQLVHRLVNELPERQRTIMQLRDVEGKSYKEIADILQITEEQVKVTLFRARQIMVMVTAVLASVGTAGIPGSGLVMLTIVLNAVHLPLETIGLLAGIDRILNMARVIPNIVGDAAAAVVVAKSEGELNTVGLKK